MLPQWVKSPQQNRNQLAFEKYINITTLRLSLVFNFLTRIDFDKLTHHIRYNAPPEAWSDSTTLHGYTSFIRDLGDAFRLLGIFEPKSLELNLTINTPEDQTKAIVTYSYPDRKSEQIIVDIPLNDREKYRFEFHSCDDSIGGYQIFVNKMRVK